MDFGGASRPANSLLAALLLKAASNDKRFVIEAAGAALGALCARMEPVLLVVRLLPYSIHKNPKARPRAPASARSPTSCLQCSEAAMPERPRCCAWPNTKASR